MQAGAEYAVTQPVFDIRLLENFLRRIEQFRIPVVAGIWPLRQRAQCGVYEERTAGFGAGLDSGTHAASADATGGTRGRRGHCPRNAAWRFGTRCRERKSARRRDVTARRWMCLRRWERKVPPRLRIPFFGDPENHSPTIYKKMTGHSAQKVAYNKVKELNPVGEI